MSLSLDRKLQLVVFSFLIVNIGLWFLTRSYRPVWGNVPPAPHQDYASFSGLGDKSFSYRIHALMLQNLGDTGGRTTPLKDYDYDMLSEWFFLQDHLDQQSDFMPYLAAYYFGGVQDVQKLVPLISYLEHVGKRTDGEKWRWLAQAVFLARFRLGNLERALELSETLSKSGADDLPPWVQQMPAYVMNAQGEKKAAYALMLEILKSSADKMHPSEVNSMRIFMCERLQTEEEAARNPLCEGL